MARPDERVDGAVRRGRADRSSPPRQRHAAEAPTRQVPNTALDVGPARRGLDRACIAHGQRRRGLLRLWPTARSIPLRVAERMRHAPMDVRHWLSG